MAWTSPVLAFVALLCPLASCQRQYVDLVSSSPAVLDSPIKFTATLRNYDGAGPFVFQWCKSEGYFGKKNHTQALVGLYAMHGRLLPAAVLGSLAFVNDAQFST